MSAFSAMFVHARPWAYKSAVGVVHVGSRLQIFFAVFLMQPYLMRSDFRVRIDLPSLCTCIYATLSSVPRPHGAQYHMWMSAALLYICFSLGKLLAGMYKCVYVFACETCTYAGCACAQIVHVHTCRPLSQREHAYFHSANPSCTCAAFCDYTCVYEGGLFSVTSQSAVPPCSTGSHRPYPSEFPPHMR